MISGSNPRIIPRHVSVNVLEAVQMALQEFPRSRFVNSQSLTRPKQNQVRILPSSAKKPVPQTPQSKSRSYFSKAGIYSESKNEKSKRVKREMLDAGVSTYGLLKSETRILPKLLHPDEHIEAVIYGQHQSSSAMLVATDERIIFIDKKPMAVFLDEVSYEVVSGLEFDIHLLFASVILHTPVRNYDFRYVNLRCAEKFARHMEKHRMAREHKGDREPVAQVISPELGTLRRKAEREFEDMAGYYWLPIDEEERQKVQLKVKVPRT